MHKIDVLVLDDEPDNIEIVKIMFRSDDRYTVSSCVTPEECFEHLAQKHYDLLITDYNLKHKLNGVDIASWTREHHPDVKIILASCRHSLGSQIEELGIDGFYRKGTLITHLKEVVDKLDFCDSAEVGE